MDSGERDGLVQRFEESRPRLKAIAYQMLGSHAEAEEAVQDAWLRLSGSEADAIESLDGWLTTTVARVCLNLLRARRMRQERPSGVYLPDPVVAPEQRANPEKEALLADSVGLALLLVLDTLEPAERLAFVLHDMFDLPFEEIGPLVDRTPTAARQLASRARRRVRGSALPEADRDLARQREVVDAFFAAARGGSFDALVAILHPDVVLRGDAGGNVTELLRGADVVARRVIGSANPSTPARRALVNGAPGFVLFVEDKPFLVLGFTVAGDRIVEINGFGDPERLQRLDLDLLDG
jgi:RNA polymerase sigma factor (sigma-70 family)